MLEKGLPRVFYSVPNEKLFDKFGQLILWKNRPEISVTELRLWLPSNHSKAEPLVNPTELAKTSYTFDTVSFSECISKSVSRY